MTYFEPKLPVGCSKYGADMGRPSVTPARTTNPARLYLQRFRLTDSERHKRDAGYDNGGAYWGLDTRDDGKSEHEKLYRVQGTMQLIEEGSPLEEPLDDWWFRCSGNRAAAKAFIRTLLPNAVFMRTKKGIEHAHK